MARAEISPGFSPSESIIQLIHKQCLDRPHNYEEIEKIFNLQAGPNYQIGAVLSACDMCGVRVTTHKEMELPELTVSDPPKDTGEVRSFIDQYITEISAFPTLTREQEIDMAKMMEVAYIRYKSSLCFCPLVLDGLDERFEFISKPVKGGETFNLAKFKALVIPGTTKLSHEQLWNLFNRSWASVRKLRKEIAKLDKKLEEKDDPELKVQRDVYRFAVAFVVKDLNIRENVFHDFRDILRKMQDKDMDKDKKDKDEYEKFIKNVKERYERYIECKNMLVNYNLKLVVSIARKFFRGGIAPMDIVQYGNQGLIRAAEDFNYKLKFKFSTYAIWWIRQKIQEGIQEQERLIRIPAYKLHLSKKFSVKDRINKEKSLHNYGELTGEESEEFLRPSDIPHAFVISPQRGDDSESDFRSLEQMVDRASIEVSRTYDEDAQNALRTHLRLYPVRERYILILRFGLRCEDIRPVGITEEDLNKKFEMAEKQAQEEGDNLGDKILDEEMEDVPFLFSHLPREVRVPLPDFKALKRGNRCTVEVARRILPFEDADLEKARMNHDRHEPLTPMQESLLALVDGVNFEELITLKPKDRVVLKRIWLRQSLKPSVARKIVNSEGLILEEVSSIFGLTKERVRQIEAKILRHISYHLVLP